MNRCCIVYGSETGTTEIASYTTYLYLNRNGIPVEIHLSNLIDLDFILLFDYVIFFVPTAAYGQFPHNFEELMLDLLYYHNKKKIVPTLKYTIFGLGDSRYPLYNFGARRLQSLLSSLEASEFFPLGLGDDQHPLGHEGELAVWRNDLLSYLKEHLNVRSKAYTFEDLVFPYKVDFLCSLEYDEEPCKLICEDLCNQRLCPVSYKCGSVKSNEVITTEKHFSSVRSIEIEGKEYDYRTGDVLCLFTRDEEVEDLLKSINVDPKERVCIRRNWNSNIQTVLSIHNEYNSYVLEVAKRKLEKLGITSAVAQIECLKQAWKILTGNMIISSRNLALGVYMPLSELFGKYLCLKNTCTPFQMYVMSFYTEDSLHKDKLLQMASDSVEGCMEYYRYCVHPRRSFYEVLYDFPSVKVPLEVLVNISSPYYSRLYSIASSELDYVDKYAHRLRSYPLSTNYPRLKAFLDYKYTRTKKIQLIVGNVTYKIEGKRSVEGLGSKYLNGLKPNDTVEYLVYKPNFKSIILNVGTPVLFIATGTGITVPKPYIELRSYKFKEIWNERKMCPKTRDMAFMGFRRPDQDHLYADYKLYEHWCRFVFVYSRVGTTKFYVQDAIREHSKDVYKFLREGIVVIGGKSHPMPSQVIEALVFVLEKEVFFSNKSAQKFIDDSINQNKIIIDTWG